MRSAFVDRAAGETADCKGCHMSWRDLINDSGPLVGVEAPRGDGESFRRLVFAFANGVLDITAAGDTDEIHIAASPPRPATEQRIATPAALEHLLGCVAESGWQMTNHRGYNDAFQVRFLNLQTRDEFTEQFEVAASALHRSIVRLA